MLYLNCLFSTLLHLTMHLLWLTLFLTILMIVMFTFFYYVMKRLLGFRHKIQHQNYETNSLDTSIGFFHPYCNAGGGGERVLWCAVKSIQEKYPQVRCVIYTGDVDVEPQEILAKVKQRFNIKLSTKNVEFVFLNGRKVLEPCLYPYFTLLAQSIGSMILGFEALFKFVPTVYLDTMGYAFTIPIFKYLGNCKVGCYVHYPTISNDMLTSVRNRNPGINNSGSIARSGMLSELKLIYYHIFAYIYGIMGRRSDIIMVNSSWTKMHILSMWGKADVTFCVYPPCDVSSFDKIPIGSRDETTKSVISVGQFRPEKDHPLQINSFNKFLQLVNENERQMYKLKLIGSSRNSEDEERVMNLRQLCVDLNISEFVEFKLNLPFKELKKELENGIIGLHTMWNEHFGIGVVECMAAGLVILAHDSGGPKMDIVVEHNGHPTGFLACDVESFASQMDKIFHMNSEEILKIRLNAYESVKRFSEKEFTTGFLKCIELLVPEINKNL